MNTIIRTTIVFALMFGGQLAIAEDIPSPEMMTEQANLMIQKLEQISGQLKLTADQDKEVRSILEGNVQKMSAVMKDHNVVPGEKLSIGQKSSLASDLWPIRKASDAKIETILNADQMAQFEKIRKEAQSEVNAKNAST